jgi:hypothetical protein
LTSFRYCWMRSTMMPATKSLSVCPRWATRLQALRTSARSSSCICVWSRLRVSLATGPSGSCGWRRCPSPGAAAPAGRPGRPAGGTLETPDAGAGACTLRSRGRWRSERAAKRLRSRASRSHGYRLPVSRAAAATTGRCAPGPGSGTSHPHRARARWPAGPDTAPSRRRPWPPTEGMGENMKVLSRHGATPYSRQALATVR